MESVNISQTRTIVPRLHYSNSLLAKILDVLKHKKSKAKKSNKILLAEYEEHITYKKELMVFLELMRFQKPSHHWYQ
jgi:hypothetical protein